MTTPKIVQINAKLNPNLDADLVEEIAKIPKRDRSRTYRKALRFYFKHYPQDENTRLD